MHDSHHPSDTPPSRSSQLHAPWRASYMRLLASDAARAGATGGAPQGSCFLDEYWNAPHRDAQNFVIARTGSLDTASGGMILLNRYPYANGHLLVALGAGHQRLLDYTPNERAELWSLIDLAVELCESTLNPQGVNVGINQGKAAGAGVPEHLHAHVVPRWAGDVNFISAVGNIRVIPSALEEMYERYRETWAEVEARARAEG